MPVVSTVLGFKDIFSTSSSKSIIDEVTGMDPEYLIFALSKTSALLFDNHDSHYILEIFSSSQTVNSFIYKTIRDKLKENDSNSIFNEKSNTEFLKIIVENFSFLQKKTSIKNFSIFEQKFFYIYLLINELIYDVGKDDIFETIETEYFLEFSQIMMLKSTIQYQVSSNFIIEFIKIKSLLNYYYNNESEILNEFYMSNSIINPDLWILEIFKLLTLEDNNGNPKFIVEANHWIGKYCQTTIINNYFNKKISENELRLNSLYFLNEQYIILNRDFFLQHLFHKIYYDLFSRYKIRYPDISTYAIYKSKVSEVAIENILFRKTILKTFTGKGTIIQFDDKSISGFPDCYVRHNNSIFILEFKDYSVSKEFIDNYNYTFIKSYIDERFIQNGKKKKAIKQLRNFISYLECNSDIDASLFNKYRHKTIDIYPIIVVTDEMFSFPAIEFYLNKRFKELSLENTKFRKIKDLTIINLSSLIDYFLSSQKLNYIELIKEYSKTKWKYKSKNMMPEFPSINKIKYRSNSRAKAFIDIINEISISDLSLEEQFENIKSQ